MKHECKICKLEYADAETAKQCQDWCSTHDSCNFMIAKQAINKDRPGDQAIAGDERSKKYK